MLHRVLTREKVDERRLALFRSSGIGTHRQLLQRSVWEVAHAVDLSVHEVEELLAKISIRLAPASCTAFDLFLESANHPSFLRTGLAAIDHALNGGLQCRGLSEFVGISGIGKSQYAMTMAVVCAMEYPTHSVMFFDVEHNFSAKRILQIATARIRLGTAHPDADVQDMAFAVVKRIRIVKVDSIAVLVAKMKEVEDAMHSLKVKLLVVDCVATLFLKAGELTQTQRQRQLLRVARDLKLFADTYQAFVVVTNRASTVEGEGGLYTKPLLGEGWAHCVTTRFILERHAMHRAITIMKSPVAGHVVQPFTIKEAGVATVEDLEATRELEMHDFAIHDALLSDLALAELPSVDPACTLRSTQQSTAEDPDETQLDGNSGEETQLDEASDQDEEEEEEQEEGARATSESSSFDLVSDSNEEEDDPFYRKVTEE